MEESPENDWLLESRHDNFCKDACLIAVESAITIAKECCHPSLSLEEIKEVVEMVYYELFPEGDYLV